MELPANMVSLKTRWTGIIQSEAVPKLAKISAFSLILFVIWFAICAVGTLYRSHEYFWKSAYDCVPRKPLDLFTIWLAVTAIFYAIAHDHELTEQTKHLEKQLKELERLKGSLSTHRTGLFPQYLNDIRRLLAEAKHLDILVDCLDYGSFFEPEAHQTLHDSIIDAVRRVKEKVSIRLLVCTTSGPVPFTGPSGGGLSKYEKKEQKEFLARYYKALRSSDPPRFTAWIRKLASDGSDDYFKCFSNSWFKGRPVELKKILADCIDVYSDPDNSVAENIILSCDYENQLLTPLLQFRQLWFAKELLAARVEIRGLSTDEQMLFWIKYRVPENRHTTEDAALFTFANAARGPRQVGFTTQDPDLLTNFVEMFSGKWREASNREPPWLKFLKSIDTF